MSGEPGDGRREPGGGEEQGERLRAVQREQRADRTNAPSSISPRNTITCPSGYSPATQVLGEVYSSTLTLQ